MKPLTFRYLLVFAALVLIAAKCGNLKPSPPKNAPLGKNIRHDTSGMLDTITGSQDSTKADTGNSNAKNDTASIPKNPPLIVPKELKHGILGYSYPPAITVGESKNIHAFISIVFPESKVRDTLIKIVVNDDPSQAGDSIVIVKPIRLYKSVSITLQSMDTILKVTPTNPNAKQQVDTLEGNKWSWTVYAKTADHPTSKLKLKIETEGPDSFEEKTITISIKVEPHFWRKIYDWLMNNPKVLIVSILIPLITFFGTKFFMKNK